ncbi:hypothetical protein TrVE_jg4016 [Triparma verrucosa]|uniref:Cyclin N-terminal domain-containing protein n=1 Tax=Triparma verrucosa TaxID=1606542 RepID=A0A9W6ZEU8_9STRA|nr:hypothetical protein TrVE_jg4016 [Triparma verrucosa]
MNSHRREVSIASATSVSSTGSTPPLPPHSTAIPGRKQGPSPAYYSAITSSTPTSGTNINGSFEPSPKGSISRGSGMGDGKAGTPPVGLPVGLGSSDSRTADRKEGKGDDDSDVDGPVNKNAKEVGDAASGSLAPSESGAAASANLKSSLRSASKSKNKSRNRKNISINETSNETFRPSSEAYTPKLPRKIKETYDSDPKVENQAKPDLLGKYKPQQARSTKSLSHNMGTMSRVNFSDALKRVAMVLHQHIMKIERRYQTRTSTNENSGLFHTAKLEMFSEDRYATSSYRCATVRVAGFPGGLHFQVKEVKKKMAIPESKEIYEFMYSLFKKVQLSSECSVVCLIYVERLMERANVPLMAKTWRPIVLCGLLLASKVWQDLSSWNIEFATVYPQFSLDCINALEATFLSEVKWDLYISSSAYAKYYFALRSLLEKKDFRNRYNQMVKVEAPDASRIQQRSGQVKEEALLQLSRSV